MLKKIGTVFFILMSLLVLNWWNVQQSEKKDALKEQQGLLLNFDKEKVEKVTIHNAQGEWELVKKNTGSAQASIDNFAQEFAYETYWLFQNKDFEYLANQNSVELLLDELSKASKHKAIGKGKDKFLSYGIDRQKLEVQIFESNKEEPTALLLIGDLNTAGTHVYVATKDQDIYLSSKQFQEVQDEASMQYMHKNIATFKSVQSILYKNGQGSYELSKENGQWYVQKPVKILADQLAVESILNHIESYEIENILDEKTSALEKNELMKNAEFIFEIQQASGVNKKLYVGTEAVKRDDEDFVNINIYRQDLPYVLQGEAQVPDSFYFSLANLAVKKVFSFPADSIKSFTVEQNKKIKTLVENDGLWIDKSEETEEGIDSFGASKDLFSLKAQKFLKQQENKKLNTSYTITIKNNQDETQSFIVYKDMYQQGNLSYIQAYSSAYDTQLLFDSSQIKTISDAVAVMMNGKKEEHDHE